MKDWPWFRMYVSEMVVMTADMSDEEAGRWFRGMMRAWITGNCGEYPNLVVEAERIDKLRKMRRDYGKTGGKTKHKGYRMPVTGTAKTNDEEREWY
jgi:hypothetical protein